MYQMSQESDLGLVRHPHSAQHKPAVDPRVVPAADPVNSPQIASHSPHCHSNHSSHCFSGPGTPAQGRSSAGKRRVQRGCKGKPAFSLLPVKTSGLSDLRRQARLNNKQDWWVDRQFWVGVGVGVLFGLTDQLLRGGFKSWHPEFLFKGRVRASERDLVSRYNLEIPPVLETEGQRNRTRASVPLRSNSVHL